MEKDSESITGTVHNHISGILWTNPRKDKVSLWFCREWEPNWGGRYAWSVYRSGIKHFVQNVLCGDVLADCINWVVFPCGAIPPNSLCCCCMWRSFDRFCLLWNQKNVQTTECDLFIYFFQVQEHWTDAFPLKFILLAVEVFFSTLFTCSHCRWDGASDAVDVFLSCHWICCPVSRGTLLRCHFAEWGSMSACFRAVDVSNSNEKRDRIIFIQKWDDCLNELMFCFVFFPYKINCAALVSRRWQQFPVKV